MTVGEYLKRMKKYDEVTFIIARAVKDDHTPYYHEEYHTGSWCSVERVLNNCMADYIILNDRQPAITWLSGVDWNNDLRRGTLKRNFLVISEADFAKLIPSREQRASLIAYIDRKLTFDDLQ